MSDYSKFQDEALQEIRDGEDLWKQRVAQGGPLARYLAKRYGLSEDEVLDVYRLGMTGYEFQQAIRHVAAQKQSTQQ
jgi:hypothetical protein